jgi:phenylpyruvate tautomerase PptA (4-oxalocrotonate tautomerase family)
MPIVDVEIVRREAATQPALPAQALADALGQVFGSEPARTWVRVKTLPDSAYAENNTPVAASSLPVFVTVLHARLPSGQALAVEALAVTEAVAGCLRLEPARVHVQYAPPAVGRQAFGGKLVE